MNRKFGLAPLIGLIIVGTLTLSGCDNPFGTSADKKNVVLLTDAGKKALTVNPSDLLPAEAKCTDDTFNLAAAITGPFKWSDSVSTPFASSDKKGVLAEVTSENCTNPTLLDMNVQALSGITIDGWNVGDHNPWMGQFLKQAGKDGLRTSFLTKKEGKGDAIFVSAEMQQTAALVNTLLLHFENMGIVSQPSLTNWHRPGGGLAAGELARAVLNSNQESLPALRLELTEKDQGCVYAFGINAGDKRFETLKCKEEVPTPTSTVPPGGSTPSGPPATTTPTCVEIPDNGKVDCGGAKDPGEDPQSQGNVPTQVQGSNPPVTSGPSAPAVSEPTEAYTPPSAPTATPPEPTTRPTPAPTQESGGSTPSPSATTCVPPPGKTTC